MHTSHLCFCNDIQSKRLDVSIASDVLSYSAHTFPPVIRCPTSQKHCYIRTNINLLRTPGLLMLPAAKKKKTSLLVAITRTTCFCLPFAKLVHYLLSLSLNWRCHFFHAMHMWMLVCGWFLLKYDKISVRNKVPGIGVIHAAIRRIVFHSVLAVTICFILFNE